MTPEFNRKAFDEKIAAGIRMGTNRALVLGSSFQARAYRCEDPDEAASFYDRAMETFEEAQSLGGSGVLVSLVAGYSLKASGITRPLYVDKTFPSKETLGEVNENVVRFLYESLARARTGTDKRVGEFYDCTTGICLENYWGSHVYPFDDPKWAATLSFSYADSSMLVDLVDEGHINIFEAGKTSSKPVVKLKVHIKSEGAKPRPIPEDQKVVSINQHLRIGREKSISSRQILIDMFLQKHDKTEKRALKFINRLANDN